MDEKLFTGLTMAMILYRNMPSYIDNNNSILIRYTSDTNLVSVLALFIVVGRRNAVLGDCCDNPLCLTCRRTTCHGHP